MSKEDIVLLDFWLSPFSARAKIALAQKGLTYECKEEDLIRGKSEMLLTSNPIYGKVPVLLHDGKPVCESTNIVYYIDETWSSPPLLPACSYGRSRARFWADFIDKKLYDAGRDIYKKSGEEQEIAKKEFIDILKKLEEAKGEKRFFGGDNFGFLDIILISFNSFFYAYEKFGGFKIEEECPRLTAWIKSCMEIKNVATILPDPEMVYDFLVMYKKMHGTE